MKTAIFEEEYLAWLPELRLAEAYITPYFS